VASALGRLVVGRAGDEDGETIAWGASIGGICLANAGLGAAHGLVAPLGGLYPRAPHGAALACLLPATLEVTASALANRGASPELAERLERIGIWLCGGSLAEGIAVLNRWRRLAQIPDLAVYARDERSGSGSIDLTAVVSNPSGSLKTHPLVLTDLELRHILVLSGCSS
jgi:alcohol dehydrogenase class IV